MSSVSETALGTIHPRLACADHSDLVRIDSTLIRAGLARLLVDAGLEVVAQVGNAEELLVQIESDPPDVAVVDIRMPPTHTDEGLIATARIRNARPKVGVLLLSQFVDIANAMKLVRDGSSGVGYLLKDRVADVPEFVDAIRRVAAGDRSWILRLYRSSWIHRSPMIPSPS